VHGLDGAVVVVSESDDPDRFAPQARLRTDLSAFPRLVVAKVGRTSKGALLLRFAGVTDRAAAEALVGATLLVSTSDRRVLDEGEFWSDQLTGLRVVADGAEIGVVTDVIMGPQTRLLISSADGSEFQVPFVAELVPTVDLEGGLIEIVTLDGLINPR